jgi:glycosyltransferase involved in cell wall biosynthesis
MHLRHAQKIFIETTSIYLGFGGIQRVVSNLVDGLKANGLEFEEINIFDFVDKEKYLHAGEVKKKFWSAYYYKYRLPRYIRKYLYRDRILFYPNGLGGGVILPGVKTVFFINDLIPITHPHLYYYKSNLYHKILHLWRLLKARYLLKNAYKIICASHYWANYIQDMVGSEKRVYVLLNPLDPIFSTRTYSIANSFKDTVDHAGNFILMNSTGDIRKGDETIFRVMKKINALTGLKLRMYGHNWNKVGYQNIERRLKQYGLKEIACHFGKVSDHELKYLFQKCFAFIYPSMIEGFGLPAMEFLSQGNGNLILRDIPLFREIFQDKAQFFIHEEDIVQIILMYTENKSHSRQGQENIQKFLNQFHVDTITTQLKTIIDE